MPSPTTLAMNKKLRTHQLILLTSGRGRSSGRTIGQILIRSQNLQITCTVKSQKELLKIKKKKKKSTLAVSLWGSPCQRLPQPHNSLSLSPTKPFGLN